MISAVLNSWEVTNQEMNARGPLPHHNGAFYTAAAVYEEGKEITHDQCRIFCLRCGLGHRTVEDLLLSTGMTLIGPQRP